MTQVTYAKAVATAPLGAGDHYEQFKLQRLIAAGTFAWVYAAESPNHSGLIALKLSKAAVTSEETALRALREVRILSSLKNPHVVHVYDHGLGSDDRWFMVMELLEGEELAACVDFDMPLPPNEAVRVVYQACLGVAEAHRAGIVHRDLKPGNLWRQHDGNIKVLDFGLARSWGQDSIIGANATKGHMLIGTPHYAQPEQVHSGRLTPASDVYSLAFMLYELLCGRTPLVPDKRVSEVRKSLEGQPLEWLSAHVDAPVVPIERYDEGADLDPRLRELLLSALAKDPAQRPRDAGEFASQLSWLLPVEMGGYQGAGGFVLEDEAQRQGSSVRRRFMLQLGQQRLGLGRCCDIPLGDDRVGWIWAIAHSEPQGPQGPNIELESIRDDGFVRVDGHALRGKTSLREGAVVELGTHRLVLRALRPARD